MCKNERATGIGAFENGKLQGFLMGLRKMDHTRGRHTWIEYGGHALREGVRSEVARNMYARLGDDWVREGYFHHYSLVPAGDLDVIDAWFRLGFGHQQVHALLEIPELTEVHADKNITIRLAEESDEMAIRELAPTIMTYQAGSPVWAPYMPEEIRQLKDGYAELLTEEMVKVWVAEDNAKILGFQAFWPSKPSDTNMITPEKTIELGVGATVEEARGHGIGSILVKHGLKEAKSEGYDYCITDYRMTNLLSSTFWPKQGFRPIAYRLYRYVDYRVSFGKSK
ncbi:GNAT family N-acetyltransferase [Cytobacillus sp. FJAT-54145]|uniref:GNAT family N-acetyltransferase n=1 Tax=Cytobacillus spartinae TaxID=3299023 RepID=A0ABW6K529_9BACI